MKESDRVHLFDNWAENYDNFVSIDNFPFTGYEQVLDEIIKLADVKPGLQILDLGIGTGNLAKRFVKQQCDVWGLDFSVKMLAQTKEKLPETKLIQANLLEKWPIKDKLFDRIVSGYVFHEFDLEKKMKIIEQAMHYLSDDGFMVIADIAFTTIADRETGFKRWKNKWDTNEHYWAADEAIFLAKKAGLQALYKQSSSCAGIFVFRKT